MPLFLCHDPYASKYILPLSRIRRIVGNPELVLNEGDRITLPIVPESRGGHLIESEFLLCIVQKVATPHTCPDYIQVITLQVL